MTAKWLEMRILFSKYSSADPGSDGFQSPGLIVVVALR